MFRALTLAVFLALPSAGTAESLVGSWICKIVDDAGDGLAVTRLADVKFKADGISTAKMKFTFEDADLSATAFATYRGKWSFIDGMLFENPIRAKITKLTAGGRNMTRSKFARDIRRSLMARDREPLPITFKSGGRILIDHGNVKENCRRKK